MTDFLEGLRDTLRERFSSPIIGPYLLSLVAFNYKFFLFLFSDLEPALKLSHIEALYAVDGGLFKAFSLPLLLTLFYLFVLPFPSRWIMRFTLWQNKLTRVMQQKVMDETPLTLQESRDIQERFRKKKAELENEAAQMDEIAGRFKAESTRKSEEIEALQAEVKDLGSKLSASLGKLGSQKNVEAGLLKEIKTLTESLDRKKESSTQNEIAGSFKLARARLEPLSLFSKDELEGIEKANSIVNSGVATSMDMAKIAKLAEEYRPLLEKVKPIIDLYNNARSSGLIK